MKRASCYSTALGLCLLGGCAATATFVIAGAAFRIGLELLDAFRVAANGGIVRQAAAINLDFPSRPTDQPVNVSFDLNARNVQAVPLAVPKVRLLQQPVAGQATVDVLVAAATESDPCTNGTPSGSFTFSFDSLNVNVQDGSFRLPSEAFNFVSTGSFTLCLSVSANADAEISINEIGISFGPLERPDGSCQTNLDCRSGRTCNASGQCTTGECTGAITDCNGAGRCNESGGCVNFACHEGNPCPSYLDCVSGNCEAPTCPASGICRAPLACDDASGRCRAPLCSENVGCPEGRNLQCSPLGVCVPFACDGSPTGCEGVQRCNQFGECVNFGCDEDDPCPSYLDCVSGNCEAPRCPASGICRAPLACDDATGRCRAPLCSENISCPEGRNLQCSPLGVCVPFACDGSPTGCEGVQRCNVFGECVNFACNEGNPCPSYLDCISGNCEAPQCPASGICRAPLACDDATGRCRAPLCSENVSCPEGLNLQCSPLGVCVPFACSGALTDCEGVQRCNEFGECVNFGCDEDDPCPSYLDCVSDNCEAPTCPALGICRAPLACDDATGRCRAPLCSENISCPEGRNLQCSPLGVCVPFACDGSPTGCEGAQRCNVFGECVNFACDEGNPCPSYLDCVSGNCEAPRCPASGICRAPLACDDATGRCRAPLCSENVSCPEGLNLQCSPLGVCVTSACSAPADCDGGALCNEFGECFTPAPIGFCGDGVCEASAGELENCPGDCPASCGDGICNASSGELQSCPQDCPEEQCCVETNGCPSEELFECPGDCCCCGAGARCVRPQGVWVCGF